MVRLARRQFAPSARGPRPPPPPLAAEPEPGCPCRRRRRGDLWRHLQQRIWQRTGSDLDQRRLRAGCGGRHSATGTNAVVGGGESNSASGPHSVVVAGESNAANAPYAAVGGGAFNLASGLYSVVGGGGEDGVVNNGNTASGVAATVPGERANVAAGAMSFAAGQRARALHDGAFVWADSQGWRPPSIPPSRPRGARGLGASRGGGGRRGSRRRPARALGRRRVGARVAWQVGSAPSGGAAGDRERKGDQAPSGRSQGRARSVSAVGEPGRRVTAGRTQCSAADPMVRGLARSPLPASEPVQKQR